jgi:hypothetical protein
MALGSTQPLTDMSTRNLPGGKGRPACEADLTICEMIVWNMWEPRHLSTLWPFMACYRDSFTFFFTLPFFAGKSNNIPMTYDKGSTPADKSILMGN